MTYQVPTSEPDELTAGDSWQWTKSLADFSPADGWALAYSVRGPSVLADNKVLAAGSGSAWSVSVAAADTAQLLPGTYRWIARVSRSGEVHTAADGVFVVRQNLAAVTAALQSHAERTLAVIEAALEGRLSADMESYTIGDRAVTKIPIVELKKLRGQYRTEVYRERNPGRFSKSIEVAFTRPDGTIGTPSPVILPWWYRP